MRHAGHPTPQRLARSLLLGFSLLGLALWLVPAWRTGASWGDVPLSSRLVWLLGFLLSLTCHLGGPVGNAVFQFFTALQRLVERSLTTACLALVYIMVLGPIAIIMRIARRDRLALRRSASAGTYWHECDPPSTRETCERQF